MKTARAKEIIHSLADGRDPANGEQCLPEPPGSADHANQTHPGR